MKKVFKVLLLNIVMVLALLISNPVQADPPGMPGGHGGSNDQPPGGGAPIGGGIGILLLLGAAYGSKKIMTDTK